MLVLSRATPTRLARARLGAALLAISGNTTAAELGHIDALLAQDGGRLLQAAAACLLQEPAAVLREYVDDCRLSMAGSRLRLA